MHNAFQQDTPDQDSWSEPKHQYSIKAGQKVIISSHSSVEPAPPNTDGQPMMVLPVDFDGFSDMASPGDVVYVGRYTLFESSMSDTSAYLMVEEVQGGDVYCVAK